MVADFEFCLENRCPRPTSLGHRWESYQTRCRSTPVPSTIKRTERCRLLLPPCLLPPRSQLQLLGMPGCPGGAKVCDCVCMELYIDPCAVPHPVVELPTRPKRSTEPNQTHCRLPHVDTLTTLPPSFPQGSSELENPALIYPVT
jgi:hypothetical protein